MILGEIIGIFIVYLLADNQKDHYTVVKDSINTFAMQIAGLIKLFY